MARGKSVNITSYIHSTAANGITAYANEVILDSFSTNKSSGNIVDGDSVENAIKKLDGRAGSLGNDKVDKTTKINGHPLTDNVDLTKGDVGLGNVDNVKQIPASEKAAPGGVASLDSAGKVPAAQLPSYVDDVLEADDKSKFPQTGETGKIYVAKDTNLTYRWTGTAYVEISQSLALGETSSTAYPGDRGASLAKTLSGHIDNKENPHNVTQAQVGLGNVNNTSDLDKPISKATQAAINAINTSAASLKEVVYSNHISSSISVSPNTIYKNEATEITVNYGGGVAGAPDTPVYTLSKDGAALTIASGGKETITLTQAKASTTYKNVTSVNTGTKNISKEATASVNAYWPIYTFGSTKASGYTEAEIKAGTKQGARWSPQGASYNINTPANGYFVIAWADGAVNGASVGGFDAPLSDGGDVTVNGVTYHTRRCAEAQTAATYSVTYK